VANAAAIAPLKLGNSFQGRLASTMPAQSRTCPSAPGTAKRASTLVFFISSSGGSTRWKGATRSVSRRSTRR
jgi:hypothetical protein